MLLEIYENRYSKITIFQKDLQQHHSSIADKQGTDQPCSLAWVSISKNTTSTMAGIFSTVTDIFISINLHPQQNLIQNDRNL